MKPKTVVIAHGELTEYSLRYNYKERLRVWLSNLWHWRTAWAVRHLSKQLQRDPGFRQAWHANIAMPIYDATRPTCVCEFMGCPVDRYVEHCELHCPCAKYGADWHRELPADQCNAIADRLIKHLFNA